MYCNQCGMQLPREDARFCPSCGAPCFISEEEESTAYAKGTPYEYQPSQAVPQAKVVVQPEVVVQPKVVVQPRVVVQKAVSPKGRWAAFFLCLILGELGIHRFYVGKVGTGLLYLFTFGLCGIGWLVDLLTILFGGFRDKDGLPLR